MRAQVAEVRFEYLPEGPPESARWLKEGPGFYFRYSSNPLRYCDLMLSREVEEGGDFFQRLRTENWDCIVMATNESLPVLMVLDWIGKDTAERIGLLNLAGHRRPGDDQAIAQSLRDRTPLKRVQLDPPHLVKTTREIRLQ